MTRSQPASVQFLKTRHSGRLKRRIVSCSNTEPSPTTWRRLSAIIPDDSPGRIPFTDSDSFLLAMLGDNPSVIVLINTVTPHLVPPPLGCSLPSPGMPQSQFGSSPHRAGVATHCL